MASWFGTIRAPVGTATQEGLRQRGDVALNCAVVEVKTRAKNSCLERAKKTRDTARYLNKPWLHVEFQKSTQEMVVLAMNYETAAKVCEFLKKEWGAGGSLL